MTDKQIRKAREALTAKYNGEFSLVIDAADVKPNDIVINDHYDAGKVVIRNPLVTDEIIKEKEELNCRDMMSSILCYNYQGEKAPLDNSYLKKYVEFLGASGVSNLWHEMWTDFQKAKVLVGVHTDNEGVTYNSIIWGD